MLSHQEIRQKFFDYFSSRGHKIIPSSPLIPRDESTLFTTAGMQPFRPYFLGQSDPISDFGSKTLCSVQKCFRTSDIEEVGDPHHHTFFEMMGNFSIGDYFKDQAIPLAWNFLTLELGLPRERMYVSVFAGDKEIPKDEEATGIWRREAPDIVIKKFGREENFWPKDLWNGPCGPSSEIHFITKEGLDIELWNLVFMEYFCDLSKGKPTFSSLPAKNIDTGMGLERLVLVLQGKKSVFETDLFAPIISEIVKLALPSNKSLHSLRIVADHLRAAVFLTADGVVPLNVGRGYVLRKILRRAVVHGKKLGIAGFFFHTVAEKVVGLYQDFYPELAQNYTEILRVLGDEEENFGKTLGRGMKELEKMSLRRPTPQGKPGIDAFLLYDTYGFPLDLTKELAQERGLTLDEKDFEKKLEEQRTRARAAAKKKGFADELIAPQHTCAHLLNAALKIVLGPTVRQAGQHLEAEKFRHDFTFHRKLTPEELGKLERLVREQIKKDLAVQKVVTSFEEAKQEGAEALFAEKYKGVDQVTMYQIGEVGGVFSKELCGGPHVEKTGQINGFKILKEESAGAGVRRIYGKAAT